MKTKEQSKHTILSSWLRENIANNTFSVGDKIPSENELANTFHFSRQTVRQAIGDLVAEGILAREQGSGTYVSIPPVKPVQDKTMRIGVVTTYLDDYIFPSIIHGIEEVLTAEGYTMALGITHNKQADEENCLQKLIASGVDGLIVEGTKSALYNANETFYTRLKEKNIPTVFINGYYHNYNGSYVVLDDRKAGEMITDILIDSGHKGIGGIFKSDDIQGLRRFEGMQLSIKKHKQPVIDEAYLWYTTEDFKYLINGGMDKMILERLEKTSGVVCYNDQVAVALINLFKRNNIRIPEDKSLVSFDNSFLAKEMVYNLTSVVYPSKKVGKKAAQLLLQCLNNPLYTEQVKLDPSVKIRGSVTNLNS